MISWYFRHSRPYSGVHFAGVGEVPTIDAIALSGIVSPSNQPCHADRCSKIEALAFGRPFKQLRRLERLGLRNLWMKQAHRRNRSCPKPLFLLQLKGRVLCAVT